MDTAAIVAAAIGLIGAAVIPLRGLLMSDSSSASKPHKSDGAGTTDTQPKPDTSYIDSTRKSLEDIRKDLGSFGTAIGVASSGLIAAATLTALDDLFPAEAHPVLLPWLVGGLAVVSIVASATLTALFFRARRRVLLDTDLVSQSNLESLQKTLEPSTGALRLRVASRIAGSGFQVVAQNPPPVKGQNPPPAPQNQGAASSNSQATLKVLAAELDKTERAILIDKLQKAAKAIWDKTKIEELVNESQKISREAAAARLDAAGDLEAAARKENEAKRLDLGITEALLSTGLLIVERRASTLYRKPLTVILAVVSAAAVFGIFGVAAWSKGQEEQLASYVACMKNVPAASAKTTCQQLYGLPK